MHLGNILAQQFRGRVLDETQTQWKDIAMMVLGRHKVKEDDAAMINLRV